MWDPSGRRSPPGIEARPRPRLPWCPCRSPSWCEALARGPLPSVPCRRPTAAASCSTPSVASATPARPPRHPAGHLRRCVPSTHVRAPMQTPVGSQPRARRPPKCAPCVSFARSAIARRCVRSSATRASTSTTATWRRRGSFVDTAQSSARLAHLPATGATSRRSSPSATRRPGATATRSRSQATRRCLKTPETSPSPLGGRGWPRGVVVTVVAVAASRPRRPLPCMAQASVGAAGHRHWARVSMLWAGVTGTMGNRKWTWTYWRQTRYP